MKRREFLAGCAAGAFVASPVLAQDVVDDIVRQLRQQGFRSVLSERTLLGRVRILAERKDGHREIIVNPRTGEILRDLWTAIAGEESTVEIVREEYDEDDDDADDDEDDDEDAEDEADDDSSGEGGGGD